MSRHRALPETTEAFIHVSYRNVGYSMSCDRAGMNSLSYIDAITLHASEQYLNTNMLRELIRKPEKNQC